MSRWRRGHVTWRWLEVALKGGYGWAGGRRACTHALCASSRFGIKACLHGDWCNSDKPAAVIGENVVRKVTKKVWTGWDDVSPWSTDTHPSRAPSHLWDTLSFVWGKWEWVQTVSRRGASAVCANQGDVYLRGYLQHAARSAEDESSAGYIRSRRARNELQEENVRGGSRTLQSASQLYWFSVTLFPNRRRVAAKETVILTPAVAAARGSANSRPDQREEAVFFATATC